MWRRGWGERMANLTAGGPGIQRVAESVLRAAGGQSVMLRMPVAGVAGVVAEQLGLVAATFADSELAPVVVRELSAGRERPVSDGSCWWVGRPWRRWRGTRR